MTDQHVVLSATLRLSWGDSAQGEARMTEIVKWRRDHQPGGQNAGSVFVNPVAGATSAGALIDGLGLRGIESVLQVFLTSTQTLFRQMKTEAPTTLQR